MQSLKIRKPDDFHCHFRQGIILKSVIGFTARHFARAVAMPNLSPNPVLTAWDAILYRQEITDCVNEGFEPLMTIQITDETTPAMIAEAKKAGVIIGKIYPRGVTNNSQNGVSDFKRLRDICDSMQNLNMVLSFHGQAAGDVYYLDRELKFLPTLMDIALGFPKLRIVMEHLSTKEAVNTIFKLGSNVAATITAHHLVLTGNDFADAVMQPHNFCIPPAQRPEDRRVLREAAMSGNPKFFFGSDSAPHLQFNKETAKGKGGVFSSPVALALLAQVFEDHNSLHHLEAFISMFGADFYGLPKNTETITIVHQNWEVPYECDGIVPFMAGQTLHWQVAE